MLSTMKMAFPSTRRSTTSTPNPSDAGTTGTGVAESEPFGLSPSPRFRLSLQLNHEGKKNQASPTPQVPAVTKMARRRHSITNTPSGSSSDSLSSLASTPIAFSPLSSPVKKTNNKNLTSPAIMTPSGSCMKKFNPTRPVPISAITYDVVARVVDSWEQGIKSSRNWETELGQQLAFQVLENDPEAKSLFGVAFGARATMETFRKEDFYKLPTENQLDFLARSKKLITAIDAAVCSLGPDLSLLQRQCREMGDEMSSWTNGCQPQQWALAGEALLQVLQSRLGEGRFTDEHRQSWIMIYNFASYHMVTRILQKSPSSLATAKVGDLPFTKEIESEASVFLERRKQASTTSTITHSLDKVEKKSVSLDCTKPVPIDDITFDMVSRVLSSWERGIKEIPNWSADLGVAFMRYIFKHTGAEGKKLMGYPADVEWDDPALATDTTFRLKGTRLIEAIDMALGFLGPDLSPLEKTMVDLGRRHYYMNCQPEHWPLVGEALFDVFRESMGKDGTYFTPDVEEAWAVIYNFLGYHMIKGLLAEKAAALSIISSSRSKETIAQDINNTPPKPRP